VKLSARAPVFKKRGDVVSPPGIEDESRSGVRASLSAIAGVDKPAARIK
jgi:hypothetical protein